jgi:small conductance mechanosensitive channel
MAWIIEHGPTFVLAIVTLIIGLWIIGRLTKLASKMLSKRNTDPSLNSFVSSMTNIGLKALLIISVADMVGIQTTSFVAIIGAAGLAVGLALQGTLANFAGGVLVLIFKPYKVGQLIEAQGHTGWVKEIQIFVTILTTPDNKK